MQYTTTENCWLERGEVQPRKRRVPYHRQSGIPNAHFCMNEVFYTNIELDNDLYMSITDYNMLLCSY